MREYVCHKRVRAMKIVRVELPDDPGLPAILHSPNHFSVTVSRTWMREKHVQVPGYYVVYEDGYASWSPVEAFEKGYTPLTPAQDRVVVRIHIEGKDVYQLGYIRTNDEQYNEKLRHGIAQSLEYVLPFLERGVTPPESVESHENGDGV